MDIVNGKKKNKTTPFMIVETFSDLTSTGKAREIADASNVKFVSCSAAKNTNISLIFEKAVEFFLEQGQEQEETVVFSFKKLFQKLTGTEKKALTVQEQEPKEATKEIAIAA